jgi:hypothetical protein
MGLLAIEEDPNAIVNVMVNRVLLIPIDPNVENKFCPRRYQKTALPEVSSSTSISPKKDGSYLSKKSGGKTQ